MNSHALRRTKIVATIGPACSQKPQIEHMIKAGVNLFRFNLKHNEIVWHIETLKNIQAVSKKLDEPIGFLFDLQGPEIRIATPNDEPIPVTQGGKIIISESYDVANIVVKVPPVGIIDGLNVGDKVLIDDGMVELHVVEKYENYVVTIALDDYVIGTKKGLNLPGVPLSLPSLTEKDLAILDAMAKVDVSYVALSFVRSEDDINELKNQLNKRETAAKIISKIENQQAIDNLDSIIAASDGIMIARGDLGIELPMEEITYWQKHIIKKCRESRKLVITATQMLQSMMNHPLPTRAEVSDVANAVFDGTDAVMLSGESATGKHPVQAVQVMSDIAKYNEDKCDTKHIDFYTDLDQTETIAEAVLTIINRSKEFDIDAILVFTETGRTAYSLARHLPRVPIFALTENAMVRDQLTLAYGLHPILTTFPKDTAVSPEAMLEEMKEGGVLHRGNRILIVHGNRWREPGSTNTITIREVL